MSKDFDSLEGKTIVKVRRSEYDVTLFDDSGNYYVIEIQRVPSPAGFDSKTELTCKKYKNNPKAVRLVKPKPVRICNAPAMKTYEDKSLD